MSAHAPGSLVQPGSSGQYGGPAGEPALGPVAFMHRVSALSNPLAPISHHWFDSTHITYGVATLGFFARTWKVEGSAFNGREPDDTRTNFDLAAMDSWSRAHPTLALPAAIAAGIGGLAGTIGAVILARPRTETAPPAG